ncbi:MAG: hypothetical protein GEV03_00640 [Streptosporangiales bacterium]|nr:hypothetical protein [Streptosporangiales bacterium]
MDLSQYVKTMKRLPERFVGRIPEPDLEGLRSMARGGEWDELLDLLVAALGGTQAPVTAAERDELAVLLNEAGMPTVRLDELNVTG